MRAFAETRFVKGGKAFRVCCCLWQKVRAARQAVSSPPFGRQSARPLTLWSWVRAPRWVFAHVCCPEFSLSLLIRISQASQKFGRKKKSEPGACAIIAAHVASYQDSLAEWSKALALGASPQGRGFDPTAVTFFQMTKSQIARPRLAALSGIVRYSDATVCQSKFHVMSFMTKMTNEPNEVLF